MTSRAALFSLGDYDVKIEEGGVAALPDGRFLLIHRSGGVRALVRVENWLSELERSLVVKQPTGRD